MCAANNRSSPRGKKLGEKAGQGLSDFTRENLAPARPGVVLVAVRDASLMMQARAFFEESVLYARNIADLPMPRAETLCSLYGSGTRDLQLARGLACRDARKPLLDNRMLLKELTNCRRFNAWSNEGIHITLEHLPESGDYVTAEASIDETREQIFAALERMDAAAREKNAHIVLFVQIGNGDTAWLSDHCAELIVIDKCEPGPEASYAFSITAMSLESQHADGIGRTMCEVVRRDNNRLDRNQTTFIASTAQDRCIWHLAREGESPPYIADLMDMDRTTVWRHLKSMPLSSHLDVDTGLPDDWRDIWLPFLGIELGADDEDDEGDVDSDPEQGPAG